MKKINLKHILRGLIFLGIIPMIILPVSCTTQKKYEDYSKEFADKGDREVVGGIESKHIQAAINNKFKSTDEWTKDYKKQISESQDKNYAEIEVFGANVKYVVDQSKPQKLNGKVFDPKATNNEKWENNDELEVPIKVFKITKNQATRSNPWEMTIKTTIVLP